MTAAGNCNSYPVTAEQIRGARAILNWSQDQLAHKAEVSVATIRKIESGHISPRGKTNDDIRHAFEDAGLEFIEPGGVRHRPAEIKIFNGHEGVRDFFDSVYEISKAHSSEIVQVWPKGDQFSNILGTYKEIHYPRMLAIQNKVSVKSITTEHHDVSFIAPYCNCRWISKSYVNSVPFYIYHDRYAIILTDSEQNYKITVIQSRAVAEAFRQQFYSMWEKATPLNNFDNVERLDTKKKRAR